jgi:hypothetical protein
MIPTLAGEAALLLALGIAVVLSTSFRAVVVGLLERVLGWLEKV